MKNKQNDKKNIYGGKVLFDFQFGFVLGGVESWSSITSNRLIDRGYKIKSVTGTDEIITSSPYTVVTNFPLSNMERFCEKKSLFPDEIRHIAVVHNDEELYYQRYSENQENIDLCLVISSKMRHNLELSGFDPAKIRMLQWRVGAKNELIRRYNASGNYLRLGYAGRIVIHQKRLDRLVELACRLRNDGCVFRIEIAGEGCDYQGIHHLILERKLYDHVLFLGRLSESEMSTYWLRQDIMLSFSDFEGHSISQVEAMANGAVPIVTDVSGARDDIDDGINGFVVPVGDIDAMKEKILLLDADRDKLECMGRAAHKTILDREQEPGIIDELFPNLTEYKSEGKESGADNSKDVPKVTVLLPSYNVKPYIRECLDSVIGQTLSDIEILCIDAGSDDGTFEILEEYSQRDNRIRVIKSNKKSYGYQMNLGIKEARGRYIGIVETDDYIEPTMFEILYNEIRKYDVDMVKAIPWNIYELDNNETLKIPNDYIPEVQATDIPFKTNNNPAIHFWDGNIWNGLYDRFFILENNITFLETPGAAFQDIGFSQQALNKADSIVYLRVHLYNYRIFRRGASIMSKDCLHNVRVEYEWLLEHGELKEISLPFVYRRMLQAFFLEMEKATYVCDFEENKIPYPEDIDWFRDRLLSILRNDPTMIERLDSRNRENLKLFMGDRTKWFDKQKTRMDVTTEWFKNLKKRIADGELVVFGAGNYGVSVLHFLAKNGIAPAAFADNDILLQGKTIYDIPVINADEAFAWHREAFYLIANRKFGYDIRNQLVRKGIDEDRIEILDGKDADLIEGIRRMRIPVKEM